MFYSLPPVGTTVAWKPGPVTTFARFTAGSVALLHFSSQLFTAAAWLQEPVQVGLSAALPGLPVLVAQFGEEGLCVAAPACLFELGDADLAETWLAAAEEAFTLVLLEPGAAAGQAQVRAVRPVAGAAALLDALRQQLRQQHEEYTWEEAGAVQAAGRRLVRDNAPEAFLLDAQCLLHR